MNLATLRRSLLEKTGEIFHPAVWRLYDRKSRRMGIDRLYLIFSFDCDTTEDAEAARFLDPWLQERGIQRVYAVPGSQLEKDAEIYSTISLAGAEFINHGYRPHTTWNGERYISSAFYHRMTAEEIREDIRAGHAAVEKVTGAMPEGFRAPHFGTLQSTPQMRIVIEEIRKMGYRFSTQTLPENGFYHGPIWNRQGVWEFPLCGSAFSPFVLLDSYGLIFSSQRREVTDEYARRLQATLQYLREKNIAGILNIYADPSHITHNQAFLDVMDGFSRMAIPSLTFKRASPSLRIKSKLALAARCCCCLPEK